ncbi:MAG: 16S rRNA (uracil(1498)-N(3))-methyltransferase [Pseudomonadota bacterium]
MARFHCPLPLHPNRVVTLPDGVARHAVGALRLREGETVTLFNGDGHEYEGVLLTGGQTAVRLLARHTPERESPLRVVLAQGISSGERMDLTVQKSVELGVIALQPLSMRRTIVRLAGDKQEKRRAHWQAVVVSACEQCGRNLVPEVRPILDFDVWRRGLTGLGGLGLMLDPEAEVALGDLPRPGREIILLAGPEGGFDPAERAAARASGFMGVRMGPRILRTETAALAALAAMQALWGDFRQAQSVP